MVGQGVKNICLCISVFSIIFTFYLLIASISIDSNVWEKYFTSLILGFMLYKESKLFMEIIIHRANDVPEVDLAEQEQVNLFGLSLPNRNPSAF